ncbi:indolepyruvate ferredoxin oxidoreductase family protein [Modestobacter lapidis]|nr:indolepyruvate ferredoxin oxidoreductase family protein [Modestobacter lapidis]
MYIDERSNKDSGTDFGINDRLTARDGRFYFSGMSMLVRLPIEQARRDRASGLRPGTLISGYPGSPMGGYDLQLQRSSAVLEQEDIRLLPAGNEEQAVTALMGTQMLDGYPHERYDGVNGFWYGKGPGVDRSGDALKHANFAGTSKDGAVVVLSGEDHEAKSSTMPFQQEYAFVSAGIPIVYPSSIAEFRTLGLHAVAMSRYAGCWVSMKLTSALCDGGEVVEVHSDDVSCHVPEDGFDKRVDFSFFPGKNIDQERHLYIDKHAAVLRYARANGLNRQDGGRPDDRIGIITAGKSAADVRQALLDLGLDPVRLAGTGVRMLTVGLVYPLDEEAVRDFCSGLEEVVVVEEKRGFLEDAVKTALQPLAQAIRVVGKWDEDGRPLFPVEGGMDADVIAGPLAARLTPIVPAVGDAPRLRELAAVAGRSYDLHQGRTPNYCSGCPHSASTVMAEGQIAWSAPGCHCFATVIEQPERHIDTMTHMGGEGLPWIGLAPFTEHPHLVQQIGDGSLYHSSYLNIRWAVATGTRMTFKLLYNGVLANTGAQAAPGQHGLAALTRGLESEGVRHIVICTKDPGQYRGQRLGRGVQIRDAEEMIAVARELEDIDDVTVMIYDESCANERRRQIKRGLLKAPSEHVLINEGVCENCGDCGAKSNCMSLQKTPTEFGPKTRIHTSSCNDDYSCVKGECPSFTTVTVREGTGYRKPVVVPLAADDLVAPPATGPLAEAFHLYMPGVGGTGVLTTNAVLAFAALLDGHHVISFDLTGAAQKWGQVLSSLVVLPGDAAVWSPLGGRDAGPVAEAKASAHTNKVGKGRADVYLALDEVGSVTPVNLDRCSPERTATVINTDLFPTGEMVRDVWHSVDTGAMRESISRYVRPGGVHTVPARGIAETLFGDYMMTNIVAVGAAYQAGLLPLSAEAIEAAIRLNGVAVEPNVQAFRYGRLWVQEPERIARLLDPPALGVEEERVQRADGLSPRARASYAELNHRVDAAAVDDEVRRLLAVRLAELIDYQSPDYAQEYLDCVLTVAKHESVATPGSSAVTSAVVRGLFKLMAYKDEYEVARLYLSDEWREHVRNTFEAPVSVSYNLQPPLLRRLGYDGKVRVGDWFTTAFRLLRSGRRLRGTPFDPFGRQASRREEREHIAWYRDVLFQALPQLRPLTAETVAAIADLPDLIRGYEQVKSSNAAKAQQRAVELLASLERPMLRVTPKAPA